MAAGAIAGIVSAAASAYKASEQRKAAASQTGPGMPGLPSMKDARTIINMSPTESNVGDMIDNFTGPPENGGFGAPESRYTPLSDSDPDSVDPISAPADSGQGETIPWLWIGGAIGAGTLAFVLLR